MKNLVQGLRTVTNPDDNWFQNIFGTYKYAHEYYNNKDYRFEIDYWNQKWLIYRSLGVEAETHKEGWFWWDNINSDEMILGINKVHLQYNLPQPNLAFYHNYTSNVLSQYMQQPLYMHDGRFLIETSNNVYNPIQVKVLNNARIPFFKFKGKQVLNIYISRDSNGQDVNYNVINQSNLKELYKLGFRILENLNVSDKTFVVTVQKTGDKIDVLFFDSVDRKYNIDEIEKKFASDWAGTLGGNYTDTGSDWETNFDPSGLDSGFNYLGKYTHKEIDVYGIARRGNEWRGLRLLYK